MECQSSSTTGLSKSIRNRDPLYRSYCVLPTCALPIVSMFVYYFISEMSDHTLFGSAGSLEIQKGSTKTIGTGNRISVGLVHSGAKNVLQEHKRAN